MVKHKSKNNGQERTNGEIEKYKEYFRNQIDELRNEMIAKKSSMDKMKQLLEGYKARNDELESKLGQVTKRWNLKLAEDQKKDKMMISEMENKLSQEINYLKQEHSHKPYHPPDYI